MWNNAKTAWDIKEVILYSFPLQVEHEEAAGKGIAYGIKMDRRFFICR